LWSKATSPESPTGICKIPSCTARSYPPPKLVLFWPQFRVRQKPPPQTPSSDSPEKYFPANLCFVSVCVVNALCLCECLLRLKLSEPWPLPFIVLSSLLKDQIALYYGFFLINSTHVKVFFFFLITCLISPFILLFLKRKTCQCFFVFFKYVQTFLHLFNVFQNAIIYSS